MSDCSKCGHKLLSAVITVEDESGTLAEIKTREGFYLDSSSGLHRIVPAGRYTLAFSVLRTILLSENRAVFYFVNPSDKDSFVTLYPEFQSWNI